MPDDTLNTLKGPRVTYLPTYLGTYLPLEMVSEAEAELGRVYDRSRLWSFLFVACWNTAS